MKQLIVFGVLSQWDKVRRGDLVRLLNGSIVPNFRNFATEAAKIFLKRQKEKKSTGSLRLAKANYCVFKNYGKNNSLRVLKQTKFRVFDEKAY